MKKQIFPLALWMFFGFVLIKAINSILDTIVEVYFNFGIFYEWPTTFLLYSIPALAFILYGLTTVLSLRYLKYKSITFNIEQNKFPINTFIIATIIAVSLNPIKNKLSGIVMVDIFSEETIYDNSDFFNLYGILNGSIGICSWLTIIILSIYFYRIY